jgi:Tol biopolymer transport system component
MNKKILIIAGSILGLIIIIVAFLLFLNGRNNSAADNQSTDQTENTNLPDGNSNGILNDSDTPSNSKIRKLSDGAVIAPALGFDDKAVWFFTADGHLYKVNLETGLKQEFLLPSTVSITDAIWPVTGNDFIIVNGNGTARTFYYYNSDLKDTANQKFITFPANVKSMDFLSDGKRIAYIWAGDKDAKLEIGDHDLKNYEVITTVPSSNLAIKVSPKGDRAILFDASNVSSGNFYLVSFASKKLIPIKTSMENTVKWSGNGVNFVFNKDEGAVKSNKLWIGSSDKNEDHDTGLTSSVSKAAFDNSGNNLFVAVRDGDSDSFWKINTATLVKTKVFDAADAGNLTINANNLFVSSDGATLYFKNSDGYLYGIDLN